VRHGFLDWRWEVVDQNYFERWESDTESRTSYISYGTDPLEVDCSYWTYCGGDWYFGLFPHGIWADADHNGNLEWYAAIRDRNYTYHEDSCFLYPEYNEPQIVDWTNYQRFVIENYSEPCDTETALYSAWGSFDLLKTSSATGLAVPGAVFTLSYVSGQTYTPEVTEYILTTDADGKASVSGLPWGIYTLQETSVPGYYVDPNVYTYHIGGEALFMEDETNVLAASEAITNDPIPPSTDGGGTPLITVAGLTEIEEEQEEEVAGGIQVLGIQELPFTGTSYILMLIGVAMIASAVSVMIVLRRRHANK